MNVRKDPVAPDNCPPGQQSFLYFPRNAGSCVFNCAQHVLHVPGETSGQQPPLVRDRLSFWMKLGLGSSSSSLMKGARNRYRRCGGGRLPQGKPFLQRRAAAFHIGPPSWFARTLGTQGLFSVHSTPASRFSLGPRKREAGARFHSCLPYCGPTSAVCL